MILKLRKFWRKLGSLYPCQSPYFLEGINPYEENSVLKDIENLKKDVSDLQSKNWQLQRSIDFLKSLKKFHESKKGAKND